MFRVKDSCGEETLYLINEGTGKLIAEHVLEPGEELEEVVSITPSEITMKVKSSNADALLAQFQTYLSQNPTWGQLGEGVIEAQVVTASSHFSELQFGTPSRAAAFDRWYDEVYQAPPESRAVAAQGPASEPSERLRTYRIDKAAKALQMTQERIFKESDAEQLVDDGSEAPSARRVARAYYTAEVGDDGTLKLRRYAYKPAKKVRQ
jgi:hypothetical protein